MGFRRTTERVRWEGASGGHLVHLPCSSRATRSWLPRATSRWLLRASKDGDSAQHPVPVLHHPHRKKRFLTGRETLLGFRPPDLAPGTAEQSLAPGALSCPLPSPQPRGGLPAASGSALPPAHPGGAARAPARGGCVTSQAEGRTQGVKEGAC